jgi:hypothetical protein
VALVENINNLVVVNEFFPFTDLVSARGAGGDLFGNGLITVLTQFHGLFSKNKMVPGDRALGLQGKGSLILWKKLHLLFYPEKPGPFPHSGIFDARGQR